ncbi:NAD(P)/FAD-dependent oxidoreductase [Streptomyces sp. NPDC059688]|uniref:NAD(P)/FAD-dependent oxidoreductase n=1 Tax=Streptomyces sp. NPDC059688 TaxID=3346906 RepID=UPI0036B57260
MPKPRVAVIIGAGLAGCLAARATRGHVDKVIIVERDKLPSGPYFRKGVPQSRQAHILLEGGQRAIQELVPGAIRAMLQAGAVQLGMPDGFRWFGTAGWLSSEPTGLNAISCTRPLIDWAVQQEVFTDPGVQVFDDTECVGLIMRNNSVAGVRAMRRGSRSAVEFHADFVVDASGSSSRVSEWIGAVTPWALPPKHTSRIAFSYATRFYTRTPAGGNQGIVVQATPESPRFGIMVPVEENRWAVCLGGLEAPPTTVDGFLSYAGTLRSLAIDESISLADPLSSVRGNRPKMGRLLRFDQNRAGVNGLIVLGDALCSTNPIYSLGMSMAAMQARALAYVLVRYGRTADWTARAQKAVLETSKPGWKLASDGDASYLDARGTARLRLQLKQHYFHKLMARSIDDPHLSKVVFEVLSLTSPAHHLFRPRVVVSALKSR